MKHYIYRKIKGAKRNLYIDQDGDWCAFEHNAHDFGSMQLALEFVEGKKSEIRKALQRAWLDQLPHTQIVVLMETLDNWDRSIIGTR